MADPPRRAELRLLVRHEAMRAAAELRRPRAGAWAAVALPIALVTAALIAAGSSALPDPAEPAGAIGLSFLAAAPVAFFGYWVLFRARDDSLLRRLGFAAASLYLLRAQRLVLLSSALVVLLVLPFALEGLPIGRPLSILAASAMAATGFALVSLAHAAALTARTDWRPGIFSGLMGLDPELVKVGPIVYAPLAPLTASLLVGAWIGSVPGVAFDRLAIVAALSLGAAIVGLPRFRAAIGRFAPRAQEMAFSPPPDVADTGLALDRGLARLLPIRPRAVLARDARVVERRFRWASSIVWPVAIVSGIALARWGDLPAVRSWVLGAGALTLVVQAIAVIGLGRVEAAGARWIDHAAGLRSFERWIGRSAYGLGLSLWLTIPLGPMWGFWAGVGYGWAWLVAGAASAGVAGSASVAAAQRWR
jgi:hypothetical protein